MLDDNDTPFLVSTPEDEDRAVKYWSWIQALEKLYQALELEGPRAKVIYLVL